MVVCDVYAMQNVHLRVSLNLYIYGYRSYVGPLKGAVSTQKALQGSKTRTRDLSNERGQ